MNENEYIFTTGQVYPLSSVTENEYIFTTGQDYPLSSVTETVETSVTSVETSASVDYDFTHIQQNSDGILLMTSGIFFLLVIYFVSQLLGNFFSM